MFRILFCAFVAAGLSSAAPLASEDSQPANFTEQKDGEAGCHLPSCILNKMLKPIASDVESIIKDVHPDCQASSDEILEKMLKMVTDTCGLSTEERQISDESAKHMAQNIVDHMIHLHGEKFKVQDMIAARIASSNITCSRVSRSTCSKTCECTCDCCENCNCDDCVDPDPKPDSSCGCDSDESSGSVDTFSVETHMDFHVPQQHRDSGALPKCCEDCDIKVIGELHKECNCYRRVKVDCPDVTTPVNPFTWPVPTHRTSTRRPPTRRTTTPKVPDYCDTCY